MFGLENRGETLIFMSRHFDNDHFDFAFSPFWWSKNFNLWLFYFIDNKITYSQQSKKSMFYSFQYFLSTFPTAYFPRQIGIWIKLHIYQQVNDKWNID